VFVGSEHSVTGVCLVLTNDHLWILCCQNHPCRVASFQTVQRGKDLKTSVHPKLCETPRQVVSFCFVLSVRCVYVTCVVASDDESVRVNLIASCAVSSRPGDVTYVVARPYTYDLDASSDVLWRLSTIERESRILDQMDRSDRGARRKAYRVLKALVKVEPALAGLSSYHVRTAVLHAFDSVVDLTPRWQRHSVVTAFRDMLAELAGRLTDGHLPHFFFRHYDLLEGVPPRNVIRWRDRLCCLVSNPAEVERVLRRRAHELTTRRALGSSVKLEG